LSLLSGVAQNISANLVMDDVLYNIYDWANQLVDTHLFYIALYNKRYDMLDFPLVMQNDKRIAWQDRQLDDCPELKHIIETKNILHINRSADTPFKTVFKDLPDDNKHQTYLGLPLATGAKLIGVIAVIGNMDETNTSILEMVAQHSSLAIRNAMLYDRSVRLADNLTSINQSMRYVLSNLDTDKILQKACEVAIKIGQAQKAAFFLPDDANSNLSVLAKSIGLTTQHVQLYSSSEYQPQMHLSAIKIVANIASLDKEDARVKLAEEGQFCAMVEIPFKSGNALTGLLALFHDKPHNYQHGSLELLEMLTHQVASALDHVELVNTLEHYAVEQAQLVQISRELAFHLELPELLNNVAAVFQLMINVNKVDISLLHPDNNQMIFHKNAENKPPVFVDEIPELSVLVRQQPNPRVFYRSDGAVSEELLGLLGHDILMLTLLPLVVDKRVLGVIFISDTIIHDFSDGEWRLMEMSANQIATQLYKTQEYHRTQEALQRRMQQLTMIESITQQISSALDLEQIMENLLDAVLKSTQADVAAFGLVSENNTLDVIALESLEGEWVNTHIERKIIGIMGRVVRTGKMMVIPDNRAEEHYLGDLAVHKYSSSLVIPLVKDNSIIGVLDVESKKLDFFKDEQIELVKNLVGHAVISIQNARLFQERQKQIDGLTELRNLALHLSGDTDTKYVIDEIQKTTLTLLKGHGAVIFGYNETTGETYELDSTQAGNKRKRNKKGILESIPKEIIHQAVQTDTIQFVGDIREVNTFDEYLASDKIDYVSLIVAPIKHGGNISEILCVTFSTPRTYEEADLRTVELLAIQAAGHLESAYLYERLHSASNRMRAILDSINEGVILLDDKGNLIETNISAENLLNIELEDHFGENFAQLLFAYVKDQWAKGQNEAMIDSLTDMARTLRTKPQRITYHSLEIYKNDKPQYIQSVGSSVFDSSGKVTGRLLTMRDVTEEQLLAKYRDEISHMVVHDLRGPLGSIISSLILMREIAMELGDETLPTLMEVSINSAEILLDLVETLLDIAKLETRQMPLAPAVSPIIKTIDKALMALDTSIKDADITVDTKIPGNLPQVSMDSDKIRRVIINLLDNAIRFTPSGGQVLISGKNGTNEIIMSISDSGPGIPTDAVERIFEKFHQTETKNIHGRRGMGLGLTFCKLAVEAHGGRIWVERKGKLSGTTISFTLPLTHKSKKAVI
jgi:K+-sensing histidine kinase KdpD